MDNDLPLKGVEKVYGEKEDERYGGTEGVYRRLVSMCLLQPPLSLHLSRSASGKPVRLTWEFYLRLDFLRPALSNPPPCPFPSSTSPPGRSSRLSSNGRSATRSNLIRITDASAWKAWKDSRTFCLSAFRFKTR